MLRRLVILALIAAVLGFGVFWVVTIPSTVPASALPQHSPNLDNGRTMFLPAAARPATPRRSRTTRPGSAAARAEIAVRNLLRAEYLARSEGRHRPMERGGFRHGDGEGHLARRPASFSGVPLHVLPAHEADDVRDLFAYLKTLPAVQAQSKPHDVPFPFNVRRTLGGWKLLFLDGKPFEPDPSKDAAWNRGAYLVNGPGHCAECHSPRNLLGGIVASQRFAGGPSPDGDDFVPNITPKGLSMSHEQLVKLLQTGETPDGDTVGGEMAKVAANTGKLSAEDRAAIATYVKSLPPVEGPKRPESK